MTREREIESNNQISTVGELRELLTPQRFRSWYRERQYRQNIENGRHYFNDAGSVPDPPRHSPSELLQCHRKLVYRQENAPEEQSDPTGIFWFGTRYEEDIMFPFFREVLTDEETYVRNSVWIDFVETTAVGDIQIKGATDPLIVDADAVPILPTEIKTKQSIESLDSPNKHHRAQLHAYIRGLSEKYDIDITEGVLLYGSRESLDIQTFYVEFDQDFWNKTVLDWARSHTEYRLNDTLPPANPEFDWECQFCSYRERCGNGETDVADAGVTGLVPTFRGYPMEKLSNYFEAHPNARLPPSLASVFPQIADDHGVYDWQCRVCQSTIAYDGNHAERDAPVTCPNCGSRGVYAELASPSLAEQKRQIDAETEGGDGCA